MTTDLLLAPATYQAELIRTGRLSPVELMWATLERIAEVQPRLNAFSAIYEEDALAAAQRAERAVLAGDPIGPLHGLPIAIKDFTPIRGKITTRGSYAFAHWVPEEDPVIVERLLSAGAIVVGKTTTSELAYSSFTSTRLFGVTRNPWRQERTAGGSSGGSAVAVATGCAALAEGSDMGGSVRIPASFCGVVGLKPSLGRIPMDILPTSFDSISHFGPLARSVDDAALFLRVTQGPDDRDIQSLSPGLEVPIPVPRSVRGLRIALSVDLGYYDVDNDVEESVRRAAGRLAEGGAILQEISLDWSREINDAWLQYWGVFLAASFGDALSAYREQMDPPLVALMERGLAMGAVTFKRIEEVRTRQWRTLARLFSRYDALVCPTMARPAPPVSMTDSDFDFDDDRGRYVGLDMTCPFNLVGQCPAISIPCGNTVDDLPIGLQIVGRRFDDLTVLRLGAELLPGVCPLPPASRPTGRRALD
jgi:Asp-tRNA(Asn)/Glu-tRNA(Gln) amidotransferase A subunit family amidase